MSKAEELGRALEGRLLGGKYRLGRVLGSGGMGVVLEAEHVGLGRRVAVKLVRPGKKPSPTELERFQLEARTAARVAADGVVQVLDIDWDGELGPYQVLELLVGQSLRERLRKGPLSPPETLAMALQLLDVLGHVHAAGIVHRDIKPGNIFLEARSGRVKVLDFGVASVRDPELVRQKLTAPGAMPGTPGYMAPEQMQSRPIDLRADLYAVAVVIYASLTGKPPFPGVSMAEVVTRTLSGDRINLRRDRPGLPERLYRAIERATEFEPDNRQRNAAELASELREALADPNERPAPIVPATLPSGARFQDDIRRASQPTLDSSPSNQTPAPSPWAGAVPPSPGGKSVTSIPPWPASNPPSSPSYPSPAYPQQQPPQAWNQPPPPVWTTPPPEVPSTRPRFLRVSDTPEPRERRTWLWIALPLLLLLAAGAAAAGFWFSDLDLTRRTRTRPEPQAAVDAGTSALQIAPPSGITALANARTDVEAGEQLMREGRHDDALAHFDRARTSLSPVYGAPETPILARAHLGRGDVYLARLEIAGRTARTEQECMEASSAPLNEANAAWRPVQDNAFGEWSQCVPQRQGRLYELMVQHCGRSPATKSNYVDLALYHYGLADRAGACREQAVAGLARIRALRETAAAP